MCYDHFQKLAKEGKTGFYEGETAKNIVEAVRNFGGCLSLEDLKNHETTYEEPIFTDFKGVRLWEIPPNGQGIVALMALNILEEFDLKGESVSFCRYQKGTNIFFNLRVLLYSCSLPSAFRRMREGNVFTPVCLFTGGYPLDLSRDPLPTGPGTGQAVTLLHLCGAVGMPLACMQEDLLVTLGVFVFSALGHNSAEYLHVVIEAVRLAFADAINYVADPSKVDVPINGMLDKKYASNRRALIKKDR